MTLSLVYKGFNYVDFYNQEYTNNSLPAVAATGANSVALTPDWGIDVAASSIYAGGETTDTTNVGTAITETNSNGMTAFVRPLIDFLYNQKSTNGPIYGNAGDYYVPPGTFNPLNLPTGEPDANGGTIPTTQNGTVPDGTGTTSYRGDLNPADINVATFFGSPTTAGSYDYMIVSEAKAAAAAGAKLFSVGTELDSLADDTNPAVETDWDNLIADVRSAAPSLKLTYSANWATASDVTFWNKLDYVGIDGYVPLSNTIPTTAAQNPSLASLEAGWNTVSSVTVAYSGSITVGTTLRGMSAIDAFDKLAQQSISKQFIFTELGYQNDTGAAADPTGGSYQGVTDPSLQGELYTAFFNAWGAAQQTANANDGLVDGIPFSLVGAYIWDWTPDQSDDGWSPGNTDNAAALAAIEAGFAAPSPPPPPPAGGTLITVPAGPQTVIGAAGDTIIGGSGPDLISGAAGSMSIIGGSGATTIYGGAGDTITGGSGTTVIVSPDPESITAGSGETTVWGGAGDTISGSTGSGSAIIIGASNSTITAGSGTDLISGAAGSMSIAGGSGASTIFGGVGDTVAGGPGSAVIVSAGNELIAGGSGGTTIWGGGGDTITGSTGSGSAAIIGVANSTITAGSGTDLISGAPGSISITGGSGVSTIWGGAGDTVAGGSGRTVIVSPGDELLAAGSGAATIWGGAGDTISGSTGSGSAIIIGAANSTIIGGSGTNLVGATAGSDLIFGGSGSTAVWAGADDTVVAGTGNLYANITGAVLVGDDGVKGNDMVTGFSQSAGDRIGFANQTAATVANLVATAQSSNGNTVITFPDGGTMTLVAIAKIDSTFFA